MGIGISVASAPVSWGIFENQEQPAEYPYGRVMDEIAAAGYAGTELGPFGYYPASPAKLRKELDRRGLTLCSAFVAMHWGNPALHKKGLAHIERSARLVGALGCKLLILSDEISPARSAVSGRAASHPTKHWTDEQWRVAAEAVGQAMEVCRKQGLRTAFHPHVGTHVETPEEVDRAMREFGDDLGLCLDTGHCLYGGGDPVETLQRYRSRILCMHLKDINLLQLDQARSKGWDFYESVRQGVFAQLGRGGVDFHSVVRLLKEDGFAGWVVVEQDVLEGGKGADSPLANATAGYKYLKSLGVSMATPTAALQSRFDAEKCLPAATFEQITEVRIRHPEWIEGEARARKKRSRLTRNGQLVLVALDHPARGVTAIRGDALAMADRYQILSRARRVLDDPQLDGVVACGDILEELLILSALERKQKHKSFLDGRVLVGSMNRGGLAGAAFEMDDTFTSINAARLKKLRCDGGKMMYRLEPQEAASGRTILACANALNDLRHHGLAAFLEPLGVKKTAHGYEAAKDAATLARQCGIAAALGESSAHLWLKLPYCEDFATACRATTLPILLLGGPARETPAETLRDFAAGLDASPRVRGAIIGRNLLFPGAGDPLPMCRALTALVHKRSPLDEALREVEASA